MSINLQKGQRIDLVKHDVLANGSSSMTKLYVGLGWDPVDKNEGFSASKKSGGFFSSLFGLGNSSSNNVNNNVDDIDVDVSVVCLNDNEKLFNEDIHKCVLYFANTSLFNKALVHSGDNLTGEGEGDDESVMVNLANIPSEVQKLVFLLNIYNAKERHQHFGMLKNAYIRILDGNNKELCRYDFNEDYNGVEGIYVAEMYRRNGDWKFAALGQTTNNASRIAPLLERYT